MRSRHATGVIACAVLFLTASSVGQGPQAGRNPDNRGAIWFVTFLQPPRQDVSWAILRGLGATDHQIQLVGQLYREYAPKEADLQWKYLETSVLAVKALTSGHPTDQEMAGIVEQVKQGSLEVLRNHLNFWERATAILGPKGGTFFRAGMGLMQQTGGSKSYPFYPYLFGPPTPEESQTLAQTVGILPEQMQGIEDVASGFGQEVKRLVANYVEKLQRLVEIGRMSETPDWKEIRELTESLVELEATILRKELEFWREFDTFLDEDQVGLFWMELMRGKWKSYIKMSGRQKK